MNARNPLSLVLAAVFALSLLLGPAQAAPNSPADVRLSAGDLAPGAPVAANTGRVSVASDARQAKADSQAHSFAGRGNPWINLLDGAAVATRYVGPESLVEELETARPLALATGDFDEDGMPDVVAGYGTSGGGVLALQRGSLDALWPDGPEAEARKAAGLFNDAFFLPEARLFSLPAGPDFLGSGDFDNDGHRDVVAAARGGTALHLLPGDGLGGLGAAEVVALPGAVTAFAAAEVNRRDGLQDLVVAVDGPAGPQLLVFEGPDGALRWEPEVIALPAAATSLAIGQMDDHYAMDIAAACGRSLVLVRGRDRMLFLSPGNRATVSPVRADVMTLPYAVSALALGNFIPEEAYEKELALLTADGAVHFVVPLTAREVASHVSRFTPDASLVTVNVSALPVDDLAVLDPGGRQVHLVVPVEYQAAPQAGDGSVLAVHPWSVSLDLVG